MENNNIKILGFKVFNKSIDYFNKLIVKDLENNKRIIIFNINPLILMNFYKNKKIREAFNSQNYNIPDGIGVLIAAKLHGQKIKQRITGIDTFLKICEESSKINKTIFLYGSKPGIALKTKEVLEKKYHGIKIVGVIDGYKDEKTVIEEINKVKPDILFVGTGSPKQELFIVNNNKKISDICLIMPIGGSMDVVSGKLKAAPNIYKKFHIEWLYRMIQEPKRFVQIFLLIKFLLLAIFKNNCYNGSED